MPGAGWCRHPERLEAQSDLVLVRSSQLTCRKGWDKDSWEPIPRGGRGNDRFNLLSTRGPVPPATEAEIAAVLSVESNSDVRSDAMPGLDEDRVVRSSPSPMTQLPKSLLNRPTRPITTDQNGDNEPPKEIDERETILKAREWQRARLNNRIRPTVEPLPSATQTTVPQSDLATTSKPEPTTTQTAEAPLEHGDEAEVLTTFVEPESRPADDDVPTLSSPAMPVPNTPVVTRDTPEQPPIAFDAETESLGWQRVNAAPTLRLIHGSKSAQSAIPDPEPTNPGKREPIREEHVAVRNNEREIYDARIQSPPLDSNTKRVAAATSRKQTTPRKPRPASSSFRRRWSETQDRAQLPEVPSVAADRVATVLPDVVLPELITDAYHEAWETEADRLIDGRSGRSIDRDQIEPFGPVPQDWNYAETVEGSNWTTPAPWQFREQSAGIEHDRGVDVVVLNALTGPLTFDPEVDEYIIAPDVPRMCQTCAAFRPAEDGERGWCSNGWAFDNRLLVSAWDVPCASGIGSWWIPNDAYWDDGMLDRLAAPAPLFDMRMRPPTPPEPSRHSQRRRRR